MHPGFIAPNGCAPRGRTGRPRPFVRRTPRSLRRGHAWLANDPTTSTAQRVPVESQPFCAEHGLVPTEPAAAAAGPVGGPAAADKRSAHEPAGLRRRDVVRGPHPRACLPRPAGFEVIALVGRGPGHDVRRAERFGIEHPCTSLARPSIWARRVSIAGPPATHAPSPSGHRGRLPRPVREAVHPRRWRGRAAGACGRGRRRGRRLGHEFRWSPNRRDRLGHRPGLVGTPKLVLGASFISMLRSFSCPIGGSTRHRLAGGSVPPAPTGSTPCASGSVRSRRSAPGLPTVDPPLTVDDSFDIRCAMRSGVDVSLIQSDGGHRSRLFSQSVVAPQGHCGPSPAASDRRCRQPGRAPVGPSRHSSPCPTSRTWPSAHWPT